MGNAEHCLRQIALRQCPQADVGRGEPRVDFDDPVARVVPQHQIDADVAVRQAESDAVIGATAALGNLGAFERRPRLIEAHPGGRLVRFGFVDGERVVEDFGPFDLTLFHAALKAPVDPIVLLTEFCGNLFETERTGYTFHRSQVPVRRIPAKSGARVLFSV